jgi:2-keto-4-pentenoate hydratase
LVVICHIYFSFMRTVIVVLILTAMGCGTNYRTRETPTLISEHELIEAIIQTRKEARISTLLAEQKPELNRAQALDFQLKMLDVELSKGASHIGWKIGGSVAVDEDNFNPFFGFILERNLIKNGSEISIADLPGGNAVVESEIGFVLKNDLPNGVSSIDELRENIDYVVGTIELARASVMGSDGSNPSLPHVIASGAGQVGTIIGDVKLPLADFDTNQESSRCWIDEGEPIVGESSNIFGGPLNALMSLANMLPPKGKYLRAGDLIITGSIHVNPVLDKPCSVRLEFDSLGEIGFKAK